MRYPETIVRLRAPLCRDEYGARSRDWSHASRETIGPVQVQPSSSDEQITPDRQAVTTLMRVISPIGSDLDLAATDRVEWRDAVWTVEGEVYRYMRPSTGALHHAEVTIRRVTG